ncbi:hypothetical protein ABZ345_10720 [Lentzea sp. NPDC005914]|uniref:hypothetical protein n=1 Tax=Lentzea sp. NPDC005914 TaxID=3154572 RepID=UPI0033EC9F04
MSKFEDNLWAELQHEHGQALLQNMAKRQSRRTKRWIGAAAAVVVLGTGALAASTYFGGAPPAYAVVDNPDGSVTLTVREVQAFEAATAELRKHGIRAIAVPIRKDCSWDEWFKIENIQLLDPDQTSAVEWNMDDIYQMKIHPERIPADAQLVLSAIQRGRGLQFGAGYARGEMPKCVPMQGS